MCASQSRQLDAWEKHCQDGNLDLAREEGYTFLDRGKSAYKAAYVGENGQLFRFVELVKDGTIAAGTLLNWARAEAA